MGVETCDRCGDIDADNYYDCDNCRRHLCEPCYGDITLILCKNCVKDPEEGKAIAEQRPKSSASFPIDIKHLQVISFAKAMDGILIKNDHKGGWGEDKCSKKYLQARLVEEVGEYFKLIAQANDMFPKAIYGEQLQKELVDISNFCMMLWDRELK